MAPLVVIGGSRHLAAERVAAAVAAARADGWAIVDGWAAPLARDRVVCTGWVRTADDARRALLAAVAGAGIIVAVSVDPETVDRLVDELRRLGPVDHQSVHPLRAALLPPEQRALLGMLAEGLSVRDAAAELGIDRHTASRLLAAARRSLGVRTTAAAIAAVVAGDA